MQRSIPLALVLALTAAALAACSKSSSFALAVMVPHQGSSALTAGAITATPGAGGLTLSDGTSTLIVTEAKLVLREIELEMADHEGACQSTGEAEGGREGCDDVEAGSTVVDLPLDGTVSEQVTATVTPGTYDKAELKVHVLGDDREDQAATTVAPDLLDASVEVAGTFDGASFTYRGRPEAEQEVTFSPPLVVAEGSSSAAVTLSVDVSTWFADGARLVDPRTAGPDGANRELVEHNIETSIDGFEDDDHDGQPHGEDSDEG